MPSIVGVVSGASSLKNPANARELGYKLNPVVNPSVEGAYTTPWSDRGSLSGAVTTRSSEQSYAGIYSWKTVMGTDTECGPLYGRDNYRIPIIGSTQYTISCYAKLDSAATTQNFRFRIFYYTAQVAGSISATAGTSSSLSVADGWKRFSSTFTSPSNALFCAFSFTTSAAIDDEIFYSDHYFFDQSSSLRDYFDGNSVGCFWTGTPEESFSATTPY